MKTENVVILGAGITGLSASYYLKQKRIDSVIFEKNNTYGGLCDGFYKDEFYFDTFAHLTFSKDKYVNSIFEKQTDFLVHKPEALNYYEGKWIRNPVQNNLFELDIKDKVEVIKGFINRDMDMQVQNYEDWLQMHYGRYFAEKFPAKYTRKYWTVEPKQLEIKWVEGRMYTPTIDELLISAMTKKTQNVHYSKEMHYPKNGGYKEFLKPLSQHAKINCNKEVDCIDSIQKIIYFKDKDHIKYKQLISTIPLTELSNIIKNIPKDIKNACDRLDYTSGIIISLGFNKLDVPPALWFYIYDEDIYPARVHSPSEKASSNAPVGCSSLQAEVYFSKFKPLIESVDIIANKTIKQLIKMNLFKEKDIIVKDVRVVKYANIIFTPQIYEMRTKIHDYLDYIDINYAGRFGEWDYLWTDQSMLSGKKIADKIADLV